MSTSKYSKYIESGVKWLGEIPAHWNVKKFQDLASKTQWSIVDGPFGSDLKNEEYTDSGIPLIQLNNIIPGQHIFNGMKYVSEAKADELIRHNAYPGDIVLAKMADPVARAAVVNSDYSRYVIVADCIRLSVDNNIADSRFAVYAINSHYFKCNAIAMSSGITRVRINMGELKRLKIALPTLVEQNVIANFLDSETSKIDELSKAFEGLIDTLKEKRQAVISHAVTKGLDPSVPMKDSGVEWLGKVPAHWDVVPYKQYVDIKNGRDHKEVEQPDGYPVFGSGGIFAYASDYLYDGESVLLGRKGTIDRPLFVTGRFWTVDTTYWTKINPNVSGKFSYYLALTIPFGYYSTNTALPSMTKSSLNSHLVTHPSLSEQEEIAKFLDLEVSNIDNLMSKSEKSVALLQERRTALISAAVTGKIDVRGLVNINEEEKIKEAA